MASQWPNRPGKSRLRHHHGARRQQAFPTLPVNPNVTITAGLAAAVGTAFAPSSGTPVITGLAGTPGTGYFVDQTGKPRLVWGDAVWALPGNVGRWSSGAWQSDYDTYFATRNGQGINVAYTKPMGTQQSGNIDNNGGTFDSLFPFQGGSPTTGTAGANPSTGLTAAYWARIDYMLASAAGQGITIFLNAIGYSSDFDSGPGPLAGKSTTEFQAYGAALGARYASTPNIVWNLADDYFGDNDSLITAFLTGLTGAGDTHAVSIENFPETTSRLTVDGVGTHTAWGFSNAQYNFVYSYNVIYFGVELAYTADGGFPVIAGDGYFYQGNSTYAGGSGAFAFDRAFRQDSWHALTSGARGKIHGDEAIWQWGSTSQASAASGWFWAHNALPIRTFVEGLTNWQKLIPDTSSALVTAGRGTHASAFSSGGGGGQYEVAFTDSYVTASMTADGTLALVYLSHGTTITVNTALLASGFTASWVDPITCATTSAGAGPTFNSTAKGSNSQSDPDWVLLFQTTAVNANPTAGVAAGTGTALAPTVAITVFPGVAAGTGTALAPAVRVDDTVAAGLASATGTALAPAVRLDTVTAAGLASATGTGQQLTPVVTALPITAAGTGTALAPAVRVDANPAAGLAAGTGTALAPAVRLDSVASAGTATATGTAQQLTPVVTAQPAVAAATGTAQAPFISWAAGVASATGTAQQLTPVVTALPATAAGTGTALAPSVAAGGNATASPGVAAATGTAQQLTPALTALPATAAGTGTAQQLTPVVTANPATAAGTGTAFTPSVSTSGNATANAGLAAATGTALAPAVRVDASPAAGLAAATGTAFAPSVEGDASPAAGLATATGTALAPAVRVDATPAAGLAAGTGTALAPSVSTSGNVNANAGLAAATGTALAPAVRLDTVTAAGLATATGTSQTPVAIVTANPGTAAGTGTARTPSVTITGDATASAGLAAATGTAQQPTGALIVFAVTAHAVGSGLNAASGWVPGVATATGTAQVVALSLRANAQAATALGVVPAVTLNNAATVVKGASTGTSVTSTGGSVPSVSDVAASTAAVTEPNSSQAAVT